MFTTLDFDVRDRIAFVTINRPEKLNALNDEVIAEIALAAEAIATREDVGVDILTGAGPKAFVEDLGGRGDVLLNGRPFNRQTRLRPGDILSIRDLEFVAHL